MHIHAVWFIVVSAGEHRGGLGLPDNEAVRRGRGVSGSAAILGSKGATIGYVATAPDGTELHREHSLPAFDSWSGQPTLSVLCAELSGVEQLVRNGESTFGNGRCIDGFDV